jgi:ABC-type phosphate/phosphonate transport system ATPase subunit
VKDAPKRLPRPSNSKHGLSNDLRQTPRAAAYSAFKVLDVDFNHRKELKLGNGKSIVAHRFACVGPGDTLLLPGGAGRRSYVACKNGLASFTPIYRALGSLAIAEHNLNITFKEITTQEELEGYRRLSDFHYRGVVLHGRRVPIIATVHHPLLPRVIGYIELATSFLMNKPRSILLSGPFSDGNGIAWKQWDLRAMRTKTNLIVRIARCVVYPELRGLGLSKLLLENATRYARRHWQVGKFRPYFIEITADMLKYLPFAERAGMHFIGFTEGNLKRVRTDMAYILKNYGRVENKEILKEESAGIVDLQVSYAAKLKHLVDRGGTNLKAALKLMDFRGDVVNSSQYQFLHPLLRFPKPTYIKGLTDEAESFVTNRVKSLGLKKHSFKVEIPIKPIDTSLSIRGLTLTVTARLKQTKKTRAIQEAFGIRPEQFEYPLISNLSFEVKPKSTVLIVGPSGAGKTLLLAALAGRMRKFRAHPSSRLQIEGEISTPPNMRVGTLQKPSNSKPIIELFGGKSINRAIYLLNMAGLSEAYLYLKRFGELSAGQQYRAMMAKMIDLERNVWFADEFCSTLDSITARIVAENMRKLSKAFGATLIVAAAHWSYFAEALQPDQVLYLMSGREHKIFSGPEFLRSISKLR